MIYSFEASQMNSVGHNVCPSISSISIELKENRAANNNSHILTCEYCFETDFWKHNLNGNLLLCLDIKCVCFSGGLLTMSCCFLEMRPQWFECHQIPFSQMWADDIIWFPLMLQKKKFVGYFKFQGHDVILSHKLEEVEQLWAGGTALLRTFIKSIGLPGFFFKCWSYLYMVSSDCCLSFF